MRPASKSRGAARILAWPALWFCACNLLAAVLAAQCSNPTTVPNQTISSGTQTFSDNNALSASSVVIDGSASVTFIAGNCIQLLPGFQAIAGTAGTTFQARIGTVTQYQLTTSVSPSGGGTIVPACPTGCMYNSGSPVTITATANPGYSFSGFSGTTGSSSSPLTVTMSNAVSETANFTATPPAITALSPTSGPSGTAVTISGSGFGTVKGTVAFAGTPATVTSWTPASVVALAPAGAAAGPVTVAVSGFTPVSSPVNFVPSTPLSITTTSIPAASLGSPYSTTLAAAGGAPPYAWSLAAGSPSLPSGLSLSSTSGVISGDPAVAGSFPFTVEATDTANATATQPLSLTVALPTLSINGGSNSAEVASSANVSLAFNLYDQAYGANDIEWGQFYLADASGNAYCYGDWGRPNGLDLYDGGTGATWVFNQPQSDSFCTVSLASITNSASDPTEVTAVLNLNFYPANVGTYTVLTQVNYGSGYAGPWEAAGTLIVDPGSAVAPTSGSGYSQTFTASFLDSSGAADIAQARLLIQTNAGSSTANQCIVRYDPAPNNLYLLADDGVAYLGPITGGGYDSLGNSQCAVTGASNVQISGTALQVDFSVVFTTNFAGSHALSLSVLNNEGIMAVPTIVGSWNVPIAPGNSTGGTTSGPGAAPDPILPTPSPQPPSPATSPQVQDCTDVSGSWTYVGPGGTFTFNLVQTSAAVTGEVTLTWPCAPVSWQVATGVSAAGVATFQATNQQVQWCQIGGLIFESPTTINYTLLPSTPSCQLGTLSESDIRPAAIDPFNGQDVPGGTSSAGPSPVSRNSDPPGLMLTSDIVNDQLQVTLSDTSKTADLQVRLSSASLTFGYQGPGVDVVLVNQSGVSGRQSAYSFPIGRLNLPVHTQYGSMIATWGSLTVTVAPGFATLGSTRFSQYNTPTESACGTVTSPAFVFHSDGTCSWTQGELNPKFMQQVTINGTGAAANSYPVSATLDANILALRRNLMDLKQG